MEPMTLRILVETSDDGWLEAQMLELDIAVAAQDHEQLLAELQHAIESHYHIARHLKRTPFVNQTAVPEEFERKWNDAGASPMGALFIAEEIVDALAAVLRAPTPIFTIREYRKVAA
jgi:hypothetical protein